jgi:hypothetical protein
MEALQVPDGGAGGVAGRLAGRRGLALVLLAGLAVQLPTLAVGFFADDYVHQLVLADGERPSPIPRWSLYDFGSAEDWLAFGHERGSLPWWTASDWKIRFFRPLTSLSIGLDHALWGERALGYHVTSLLLWLGLLVLVHRLYLALGLAPLTAVIGLALFALSDASSIPVGWIANRNSLLEALLAAGALLAALRGHAPGALALALAAALAKESGALALLVVAAVLWRRAGARGRRWWAWCSAARTWPSWRWRGSGRGASSTRRPGATPGASSGTRSPWRARACSRSSARCRWTWSRCSPPRSSA